MNKSLSSAALTWYKYVGPKFAVSNANRREQITEGTVVGIRPIARSEDYYLALKSEPEKMFRINSKRARVIAQKSKAVRVMIGKPELTKEAKDVVDAATGSRLNAERFKPLVPPRNELKTDGVKTSNYQWRVVKDTKMEVDTNKSGRTLTLKRGDIFGLRFVLPTQGGKFVMLDGTYETIPTSQYDSLVQQTPLLPHARWPDTVLSPELIQEYRDRMQRQRISARHEREREERAQDAAVNNARKEAERKAKDQERVVRVNDGKENTQIAKMVTDAARAEAARIQANLEERRRNAGLKDEDLRRMKSADGKTRFSDALDAADSTDDDLGTDLEDNIENSAQRGLPVPAADTKKKKLETLSHQLADLYNQVQNAYRKKIRDKDKLSQMLTDIRAQYVEDVPKMRAGDEGIIQAWEEMLSKAEDFVEKKPAPTAPVKKKPEVDPNDVDADLEEEEQADDTEEAADEEDPDANDVDSDLEEEDPDAESDDEEVDPDAEDEEVDPDAEDEDGFEEEEDDADTEDTDAADDEETANDEESDEEVDESEGEEESDDEPDGESEENSDDEEVDEDFDPAEMSAEEDSDGISRELAGGEVDEEADDLSDVDEEEDVPPAPVKKTKPKVKEKEPEPKEDAGNEDEEEEIAEDTDSEEPSDEEVESDDENIDDVDEDTQSDENADDDLPQAAGIKTGNVDSDEGDIIVFHDDTKQKRKFAIIQITPNEKDDRILEYTVWDIDNKPESYKVVRINTGRNQHITDMADKVGQMPPKQFNQVADQVADYEYDKSPIKS